MDAWPEKTSFQRSDCAIGALNKPACKGVQIWIVSGFIRYSLGTCDCNENSKIDVKPWHSN